MKCGELKQSCNPQWQQPRGSWLMRGQVELVILTNQVKSHYDILEWDWEVLGYRQAYKKKRRWRQKERDVTIRLKKKKTSRAKKFAHGARTAPVFTTTLITRVQLKTTCATAQIYSYIFSVLGGGHIKSLWEGILVTSYFEWLIFHLKNTHSRGECSVYLPLRIWSRGKLCCF